MSIIPRGIRNRNPGNIRRDGTHWEGMSPNQDDPDFVVFTDPKYGIRAITRILRHYKADGLNTVRAAISRWAPPSENNTEGYIAAVACNCGIPSTLVIDFDQFMPDMVTAIIRHENGMQPYDDATIQSGIALA
jgi:hypothetical protein